MYLLDSSIADNLSSATAAVRSCYPVGGVQRHRRVLPASPAAPPRVGSKTAQDIPLHH